MKLTELLSEPIFLTEDDLMEMATLSQISTGVKVNIWIGNTDKRHGWRVKVSNFISKNKFKNGECFVVTISNEPKVVAGRVLISNDILDDVIDWVKLNKDILISIEQEMENGSDFMTVISPLFSELQKI